jgi:hypothetical protein
VNLKITIPSDDNFSDDELSFTSYWAFWRAHVLGNVLYTLCSSE